MGFSCGFIGLPNVGKSTLFNALTSGKAASENFPFCTIEPNTGAVPVPDERLLALAEIAKSAKVIPTQMTFVDIAGLIRGASKGEGLGNQFLGHIRSVDAVAHIVRCFDDEDIVHVEGKVDPVRDAEVIETELLLADLEALTKQKQKFEKLVKTNNKLILQTLDSINALERHVGDGHPARNFPAQENTTDDFRSLFTQLLSSKRMLYVGNIDESQIAQLANPEPASSIAALQNYAQSRASQAIFICGKLEAEIAELPRNERQAYLEEAGIHRSGLDTLAQAGYRILDLLTFFTAGPQEARAWTAEQGSSAPQCAGKIHSDFERGFIRAEVISYEDYVALGGEVGAREKGKMRLEGKEYIMKDGDVVHFRFNV